MGRGGIPALSQEQSSGQGRHSGRSVNNNTTGKVEYAHLTQETVGMPGPVGQRTINKKGKKCHKHQIAGKMNPLGKRTGNQGRGNNGKLHLKQSIQRQRNGRCQKEIRFGAYSRKHGEGQRIADKMSQIIAKSQTEPDDNPDHTDHTHGNETLQNGGNDILPPYHTAIEKRKARCHHQNEYRSGNHPGHIRGIEVLIGHPEFRCFRCKYSPNTDEHQQTHHHNPSFLSFHNI